MMRNHQLETSLERYVKLVRESFFSTSHYEKNFPTHVFLWMLFCLFLFIFCNSSLSVENQNEKCPFKFDIANEEHSGGALNSSKGCLVAIVIITRTLFG